MNPIAKEGRRQKVEHFKKQALLALTTAFRAPLMLMMGCGYVTIAKAFNGTPAILNDADGKKIVRVANSNGSGNIEEKYDESRHGEIVNFVEEGQPVPGVPNSTRGKIAIHRHHRKPGTGGIQGAHEFSYE